MKSLELYWLPIHYVCKQDTPFFLYKHEGKFTPASIMLSFLRISGSNYAYDMLRENFENKNIKIKKPIFCLSFEE